jgi:ATP-dependent RNA helicase RhlE
MNVTTLSFNDLGIAEPLQRALNAEGYTHPTPIQQQAIPVLLQGRDLLGLAQTGTGKTAAFALPLLQRLSTGHEQRKAKSMRGLILAPTRELVIQISDSLRTYGRNLHLKHFSIVGGVSQGPQVKAMAHGVDILVATPGRLLDLVNQGHVRLDGVQILILDEADRMLDMGFIRDIRKIVDRVPKQRHSMLFSATMPKEVEHLAQSLLSDPLRIDIVPPKRTAEKIEQSVYFVPSNDKRSLLTQLLRDPAMERVLVFTRTKHVANRVAEHLEKSGVPSDAIHGNKSQNARQRALQQFRDGQVRVLVATDIAARGIDIDNVSHVINFELPNEPESYVHRIGRTARAGTSGIAISFCDGSENAFLRQIERMTKTPITVAQGQQMADSPPPGRGGHNNNQKPRNYAKKTSRFERSKKFRGGNGGGAKRAA